ncbi:MAG: DUF2905 domain-containing protein [Dethiobacter sp.]|jgi:hypothetical protein|nr:DUF2905 domain-containing protein [Dethiobacter sp.]MBS3898377.1 DUF2905 domain-containing protein [Dethiobacter sp.]MBS3983652.1 DUF2905 domain-containing protein [Dethiobacter sp.]
MTQFSRYFILIGVVFLLIGLILAVGGRLNLGRLPGDIVIKRENFTFYFPVMTGIILSILLSLLFKLYNRFF